MVNEVGARQVGDFGTMGIRKQIVRSMRNPIDVSTIVSIFPKEVYDRKHTIEPGEFRISAGTFEEPALLKVGSSSWFSDRDDYQPMLEIPVSSVQVANAVINNYCNGLVGCNMNDSMPGMFFVIGDVSLFEVKQKYKDKMLEAKKKQDVWFTILIRLADSLWARSNGNPLTISDEMRLAAQSLARGDKPWMGSYTTLELVKCNACGNLRNPEYPICPACRVIDATHPLAKDLKFAQ